MSVRQYASVQKTALKTRRCFKLRKFKKLGKFGYHLQTSKKSHKRRDKQSQGFSPTLSMQRAIRKDLQRYAKLFKGLKERLRQDTKNRGNAKWHGQCLSKVSTSCLQSSWKGSPQNPHALRLLGNALCKLSTLKLLTSSLHRKFKQLSQRQSKFNLLKFSVKRFNIANFSAQLQCCNV